MQLYERVRYIIKNGTISQAKIAKEIGVSPAVFSLWLNEKSQKNIWEHLPKILELYPTVNRHWIYFGEGEVCDSEVSNSEKDEAKLFLELEFEKKERLRLEEKNTELIKENARLNYQLEEFELKQSKQAS